jgi:hypothetical protein
MRDTPRVASGRARKQAAGPPPKWTVMVFMSAERATGFAPLKRMALADIAEMRKVPPSSLLEIFVQLHDDDGTHRYRFNANGEQFREMAPKAVSVGALSDFVESSLTDSRTGPDDHTMLVVWGHTYQHAVGQSPRRDGSVSTLDFNEFVKAFASSQERRQAQGHTGKLLDIIAFDACDLSALEVALQLEPFADFLLSSEMGVPLPGWPYDRILERIQFPQGRVMGPAELGSFAVRRFCESYANVRAASLTLLRLSEAPDVTRSVDNLARRLLIAVARSAQDKRRIFELFSRAQTDQDKPFVDLADLCLNLIRESDDEALARAAAAVGDRLLAPAPAGVTPGNSATGVGHPFVHEHGRNAVRTAKLNGVSLYAPHVAGPHDIKGARAAYETFTFAQETLWSTLVHNLAGIT